MKKKLFIFIGVILVGFAAFVGFNVYQSGNIEVIQSEELQSIEVSTRDNLQPDTTITVETTLDNFEAISIVQTEVVEDTLYLIIHKWPAFQSKTEETFTLENVQNLGQVNQISVIFGDPYTGEGDSRGIFLNDLIDHPDQEIVWTKEGNE